MCTHKTLAVWLNAIGEHTAWMNGTILKRISFRFDPEGVLMTVVVQPKRGEEQVGWIKEDTCRKCLQYLYRHYGSTNHPIGWQNATKKPFTATSKTSYNK